MKFGFLLDIAVAVSFVFVFVNGFHDGCNVFATAVASRSIKPRSALLLASLSEFIIPVLGGTAVASTIGKGILSQTTILGADKSISIAVVLSALTGSIIWNLITWKFALPSSSSHALIGGLLGAGLAGFGFGAIKWLVLLKKIIPILLITPILGFTVGWIVMKLTLKMFKGFGSKFNRPVKKLHYFSIAFLGGSHGTADSQLTMGVLTLLMVISGNLSSFSIPIWIKVVSPFTLALGLLFGGWRMLNTIGNKIYKLNPLNSINVQISSASVIFFASMLGGTVSTSQVVSSTVIGVGSAERYNAVNWKAAENILSSWILTIPASALLSIIIFFIIRYFLV